MNSEFDYSLIWLIYLSAGALFYWVLHNLTKSIGPSWWFYSLRALYFGLAFTPAYANDQGNSLAPALMVSTLDLITGGSAGASRAIIPLLMVLLASIVIATIVFFYAKKQFKSNS
ncbi:MAG: hypothetical protein ACJA2Q_000229 [Pseudohongiellaceae bacterium]|jgi:hypothetical protein